MQLLLLYISFCIISILFYIKNINIASKGMSQWLRVHKALADNLFQAPTSGSHKCLNSSSGGFSACPLLNSIGTCTYMYTSTHKHRHTQKQFKINEILKNIMIVICIVYDHTSFKTVLKPCSSLEVLFLVLCSYLSILYNIF